MVGSAHFQTLLQNPVKFVRKLQKIFLSIEQTYQRQRNLNIGIVTFELRIFERAAFAFAFHFYHLFAFLPLLFQDVNFFQICFYLFLKKGEKLNRECVGGPRAKKVRG